MKSWWWATGQNYFVVLRCKMVPSHWLPSTLRFMKNNWKEKKISIILIKEHFCLRKINLHNYYFTFSAFFFPWASGGPSWTLWQADCGPQAPLWPVLVQLLVLITCWVTLTKIQYTSGSFIWGSLGKAQENCTLISVYQRYICKWRYLLGLK